MGDQLCGVIHRSNKLLPSMEHHQVCFNNVPDGNLSPQEIIKTPEFRPGI